MRVQDLLGSRKQINIDIFIFRFWQLKGIPTSQDSYFSLHSLTPQVYNGQRIVFWKKCDIDLEFWGVKITSHACSHTDRYWIFYNIALSLSFLELHTHFGLQSSGKRQIYMASHPQSGQSIKLWMTIGPNDIPFPKVQALNNDWQLDQIVISLSLAAKLHLVITSEHPVCENTWERT